MTNFDRKNVIQEIADSYVNRSLFSGIEWVAEKSGKIVFKRHQILESTPGSILIDF